MSGQDVVRPAELARVSFLGALFCVIFCDDIVAFSVAPTLARATLDDEFGLLVCLLADDALAEGLTGSAKGVVLEPLRVETGIIGSTACADGAPEKRGRESKLRGNRNELLRYMTDLASFKTEF